VHCAVISSNVRTNAHYAARFFYDGLRGGIYPKSRVSRISILPIMHMNESLTINETCEPSVLPIRASTLVHTIEDELP